MNNGIQVIPLSRSHRDILRFLKVSYGIYENDPHWVAPLLMDLKQVFTDANPLFAHADMQLWVATRDGRDIGRIAGILDHNFNRIQQPSAAFFGFFECLQDAAAGRALFDAALAWARAQGVKRVIGPMNPTANDECGLLVKGFDSSPWFMMTYNPAYYVDLVEAAGFAKAKDLLAFHIDLSKTPMARFEKIARKVRERCPELSFRPLRRKSINAELGKIKEIYNEAWEDNWGFVPMTDAEVDFLAARLKPLLMEGIVWIVEKGTEPVAFLLALPDYNLPIKPLRGRLLTPRLLGFIPYLLQWKYPPRSRVIALGVKKPYRAKGLESVMLYEGLQAGARVGFTEAEASWILEDNEAMCRMLQVFGATPYKTYRLYERAL